METGEIKSKNQLRKALEEVGDLVNEILTADEVSYESAFYAYLNGAATLLYMAIGRIKETEYKRV